MAKLTEGRHFIANTPKQRKYIKLLLENRDVEVYDDLANILKGQKGDKQYVKELRNEYLELTKKNKKIFEKERLVMKKMNLFINNLQAMSKNIQNPKIKTWNDYKPFEIVLKGSVEEEEEGDDESEEEVDDEEEEEEDVDLEPTVIKYAPNVMITKVYEDFLENRKSAYNEILSRVEKGGYPAESLRTYINNKFGFDSSNPMYIPKTKAGKRTEAFKKHFDTIGYVNKLDKAVPIQNRKEGGIKYNEYLKKNDPEGKLFITETGLMNFLEPDYELKSDISQKDYLKIKGLVNKRLQLMGKPKIMPASKSKTAVKESLKNVDFEGIINIYKSLPHLKRPSLLIEQEQELDKLRKEMEEGTTDRAIEANLGGLTAEEIIASQFNERKNQMIVDDFLTSDKKNLKFNVKKIAEPKTVGEASEAISRIITNVVMKNKIENAINILSKQQSFRENTQGGRHNMITSSIGSLKVSPTEMNKAIDELDKLGFIGDVQNAIYGFDYKAEKQDINEINKNTLAINYLQNKEFLKIRQVIEAYNEIVQPDLSEAFNKRIAETIEAPADVRVLPKGVRLQPVPEAEMRTDITRIDEITKKIKQIQIDKIGLAGDALNQITTEEKLLRNQLKDLTDKSKNELKKKAKRAGQVQQASKRVGDVRPHFKNPTETAVQNAIGETPEEQIKDFNNWFVFDIPKDQTGQGTKYTNPLVKQNEQRESFIGEGNIFDNFNQTFELTDGIEERKKFYDQHSELTKEGVNRGLKTSKIKSEEEQFLASFNKDSNGLFTQDQSTKEINNFKPIYQTPNNFFGGTMYPFQNTANDTLLVSNFESNLNYFIEP